MGGVVTKVRNLDLNLLVSLEALLQERSVTHAATSLGLSQPALSAALARLRRHFRDDLLTRVGNRYELTPLAVQLKERATVAMTGVERVFQVEPDFDAATSTHEFTVCSSDFGLAVLGGPVSKALFAKAPGVTLRWHYLPTSSVDNAAEVLRGVDAFVLPHGFITGLPYADLFRDDWVCVVADDNAAVGEVLTIANLAELPWVLTFHAPTAFSPPARQMRQLGVEPHIQMVVESYLAIPSVVRGTDRIALLQAGLAAQFAPLPGLRFMACPFDAVPLIEALWWHPMYDRDPEHTWLRDLIVTVAGDLGNDIRAADTD